MGDEFWARTLDGDKLGFFREGDLLKMLNKLDSTKGGGNDSGSDTDSELSRGTKVTVNYNGKGKYYAGKISRVNSNGTYDIEYNDGDRERGVKRDNIKVSEGSSSKSVNSGV